jgi:hypothetical protein
MTVIVNDHDFHNGLDSGVCGLWRSARVCGLMLILGRDTYVIIYT